MAAEAPRQKLKKGCGLAAASATSTGHCPALTESNRVIRTRRQTARALGIEVPPALIASRPSIE